MLSLFLVQKKFLREYTIQLPTQHGDEPEPDPGGGLRTQDFVVRVIYSAIITSLSGNDITARKK